jgi:REP element-mobilizing transposase RayT
MKQQAFAALKTHWKYRLCHGGALRKSSKGRGARPLSSKDPIHLVFKVNKVAVRGGLRSSRNFNLVNHLLKRYSLKFFVKIEQLSVQTDHIHLLIRGGRRSQIQSFLRVLAGQFAQRLTDTFDTRNDGPKIWKHRPFTRIVKGYKPYLTVRNYIQLNECEANGRPYSKTRLRGLSQEQLQELWV